MLTAAAALVAVALAAGPAGDRALACRARVLGDPALARSEAVAEAVRERAGWVLDYGVPCESAGEAARAARRAGLSHAVLVTAEGRTEGSLYELTLVAADERVVAVRRLSIPPGGDNLRPVAAGLEALVGELRRPAALRFRRRAALGIAGGGVALIAAGTVLAAVARSEADRANAASTPSAYLASRHDWEVSRGLSGAALGIGGAALAAGLAWRVGLAGEE